MKIQIKKKLRDLTKEQYEKNKDTICNSFDNCEKCPFRMCTCVSEYQFSWVNNKDMFSDKFLDQEVEINVEIFTEDDKQFLKECVAYLNANDSQVVDIMKCKSYDNSHIDRLSFGLKDNTDRVVMWFRNTEYLINMPYDTVFQIKDLGLDEK